MHTSNVPTGGRTTLIAHTGVDAGQDPAALLELRPTHPDSLTVGRARSDRADPLVVPPLPAEDAFLVRVELLSEPSRSPHRGNSTHATAQRGAISILDLTSPKPIRIESPFYSVLFHVPATVVGQDVDPRFDGLGCEAGTVDPVLLALAEAILPSLDDPRSRKQTLLDTIELAFRAHVARVYGRRRRDVSPQSGGLAPWQEKRAKHLLCDARTDTLSVEDVARTCRLSRGHFSKAFKRSTGSSPHAWAVGRRVESAKELLRNSDSTISEVALACGFYDQSHLTRMFSQHAGTPPAAWRRQNKS